MTLQAPTAVRFSGANAEALQIAGYPSEEAIVVAVTDSSGSTRVALPTNTNSQPYAAYEITNLGTDPVYFAFGDNASTIDHTSGNFDSVIVGGTGKSVANVREATHVIGITSSGTASLVVAPWI